MDSSLWLQLIAALSLLVLAITAIAALSMVRGMLRQRRSVQAARAMHETFSAEHALWLNSLGDREMTALLATRLRFTPDFLGTVQLQAENALRVFLLLRSYENAYHQFTMHHLPHDGWNLVHNEMHNAFADSRTKAVYERSRQAFSAHFTDFIRREFSV
jgi:hypothetical protein